MNNPALEQVFGRDRPDHKRRAQVGCDPVVLPGPKGHQPEPGCAGNVVDALAVEDEIHEVDHGREDEKREPDFIAA